VTLSAKKDEATTLALMIATGTTGLYPQAEVWNGTILEAVIDLLDRTEGRYEGSWTPTDTGLFSIVYNVYQDVGHTIELTPVTLSREMEQVLVTEEGMDDLAALIAALPGEIDTQLSGTHGPGLWESDTYSVTDT
jgi:hypothetical protein